jgi:hypothetical protein
MVMVDMLSHDTIPLLTIMLMYIFLAFLSAHSSPEKQKPKGKQRTCQPIDDQVYKVHWSLAIFMSKRQCHEIFDPRFFFTKPSVLGP